ncbi:MAG: hypothetical protein VW576_02850 [Opitutae bacterium]
MIFAMLAEVSKYAFLLVVALAFCSCGRKISHSTQDKLEGTSPSGRPPAYVQKAWDARYSYDADRRLLVPQYAGSRWGAVQQYKEEGELVYQDWWIRDVRSEDLEASPDTTITSFLNEDGNLTLIPQESEDPFAEANNTGDEAANAIDPETDEAEFPPSLGESEDPFVPSPFSPF